MKTCTNCGTQSYRAESRFCLSCGTNVENAPNSEPDKNICTNPGCKYHSEGWIYPDDARFCDGCGTKTAYAI